MKAIKITFLVFLSFLTFLSANAQNWEIFNPDNIYNFQYSDSEYYLSNSIWVDSIEEEGTDTILYFNRRAVRDSIFLLANQPHFLQRKAKLTNSWIHFLDTASYVFLRNIEVGNSWLFDTLNNIYAICTDNYSTSTFGNPDSVKFISLSNNDTILLSKNYGLLQFPDFSTDERYILKGIDNMQIGECSPKFADFFTFEVGDVFVYQKTAGDPGMHSDRFDRYTILNILSLTDSISYKVKDEYWHHIDTNPWPYLHEAGTDTITITYKPDEYLISEFYNDQLVVDYDEEILSFVQPSQDGSYFSFSNVFIDELSLLTKKIGFARYWSFENAIFLESPIMDTFLMYTSNNANYILTVKKGIGLYEEIWEYFEMGWEIKLLAWHTQNSSFGNLDTVPVWWLNQPEIETKQVSIYPNPSGGSINISGLHGIYLLSIYDISGKQVFEKQIHTHEKTIYLEGIDNGIYILEFRNFLNTYRQKMIISKN